MATSSPLATDRISSMSAWVSQGDFVSEPSASPPRAGVKSMVFSLPDSVIKVTNMSSSAKRKPSLLEKSSSSSLYPAAVISWIRAMTHSLVKYLRPQSRCRILWPKPFSTLLTAAGGVSTVSNSSSTSSIGTSVLGVGVGVGETSGLASGAGVGEISGLTSAVDAGEPSGAASGVETGVSVWTGGVPVPSSASALMGSIPNSITRHNSMATSRDEPFCIPVLITNILPCEPAPSTDNCGHGEEMPERGAERPWRGGDKRE